jgi:hypothetical protein
MLSRGVFVYFLKGGVWEMDENVKLIWLKRVLFFKTIVTIFVWGLPALFGTTWFLSLFGMSMPVDPIYLRLFGAVVIAFGVAYWFAYRDPIQNRAIVQAGVVDNGLVTLVVIYFGLTSGLESWFLYLSALLTGFFFVAFILLMPARPDSEPELGS